MVFKVATMPITQQRINISMNHNLFLSSWQIVIYAVERQKTKNNRDLRRNSTLPTL